MKISTPITYIIHSLGYAVVFPFVVVSVFLLMGVVETQFDFHTWDRPIDMGMMLGCVIIGAPIYFIWFKILIRFGVALKNSIQTHFIQCALLYLVSVLLIWPLWLGRGSFDISYAYAVLAVSCAIIGIGCNILFLGMTAKGRDCVKTISL